MFALITLFFVLNIHNSHFNMATKTFRIRNDNELDNSLEQGFVVFHVLNLHQISEFIE